MNAYLKICKRNSQSHQLFDTGRFPVPSIKLCMCIFKKCCGLLVQIITKILYIHICIYIYNFIDLTTLRH